MSCIRRKKRKEREKKKKKRRRKEGTGVVFRLCDWEGFFFLLRFSGDPMDDDQLESGLD